MTGEEAQMVQAWNSQLWREQKQLSRENRFHFLLLLVNLGVCVWLCSSLDWMMILPLLLNVYSAAISLSAWRNCRKFIKARAVFCASMDGMLRSYLEGNHAGLNHHDDQSDAALAEMKRLAEINYLRPMWK